MAKVKIQGNASGTGVITLVAPNTNTDRTVTLPDEDITLGGGVDGIVSTANATAITIDSSERVGLGTSTPSAGLEVASSTGNAWTALITNSDATDSNGVKITTNTTGTGQSIAQFWSGGVQRLKLTGDGRGLSQFTAKAWVSFNGTGTVAIRDSHNVSSITDQETALYTVNFTNAMSNANYALAGSATSSYQNTGGNGRSGIMAPNKDDTYSTTAVEVFTKDSGDEAADSNKVSVIVFGD